MFEEYQGSLRRGDLIFDSNGAIVHSNRLVLKCVAPHYFMNYRVYKKSADIISPEFFGECEWQKLFVCR